MASGVAGRLRINLRLSSRRQKSDQAIALGTLGADLPDKVPASLLLTVAPTALDHSATYRRPIHHNHGRRRRVDSPKSLAIDSETMWSISTLIAE